jgi:hypothetical protein
MGRTRRPSIEVEEVISFVREKGIADVTEVAHGVGCSTATARRKLDAAVFRGELIMDDHDAEGRRLGYEHYRYGDND